jgi:hypothetical protein
MKNPFVVFLHQDSGNLEVSVPCNFGTEVPEARKEVGKWHRVK